MEEEAIELEEKGSRVGKSEENRGPWGARGSKGIAK